MQGRRGEKKGEKGRTKERERGKIVKGCLESYEESRERFKRIRKGGGKVKKTKEREKEIVK